MKSRAVGIRKMSNKNSSSKMVIKTNGWVIAALMLSLMSARVDATVTLDTSNYDCIGSENSTPTVIAALEGSGCAHVTLTELYKSNAGGLDEKTFADSYDTAFSPTSDPQDALMTYLGASAAYIDPSNYSQLWALAKDGRNTPGWYAWDLLALGWNGTEDLLFNDLWLSNGSISHISIFSADGGGSPPQESVVEPSMLSLLGIAVAGLAASARRRRPKP